MFPSDGATSSAGTGAAHASSAVAEVLNTIERLPWGDLGPAILAVRDTLELLMLITRDGFELWEEELGDRFFSSEYDVPVEDAVQLPTEQRLAHVARLVRSLALHYGLRTDCGLSASELELVADVRVGSAAWVLDQLDRATAYDARREMDGA